MIQAVRWLMPVPASIVAWYVALFIGLLLHGRLFALCPEHLVAYDIFCDASWFPAAERALICFGAALSAVLVVSTAAIFAPTHKIQATCLALATGAVVASVMAFQRGEVLELVAAVVAGSAATYAIRSIVRRSQSRSGNVA